MFNSYFQIYNIDCNNNNKRYLYDVDGEIIQFTEKEIKQQLYILNKCLTEKSSTWLSELYEGES